MRYFPGTGRCDPELAAPANRRALTEDDLTQMVDDAAGFAGQSATSADESAASAVLSREAADDAETAAGNVEQWSTSASESAAAAGISAGEAAGDAARAESAADDADASAIAAAGSEALVEADRVAAATARDQSVNAAADSATARDASVTAKGQSEDARDLALQYRDQALAGQFAGSTIFSAVHLDNVTTPGVYISGSQYGTSNGYPTTGVWKVEVFRLGSDEILQAAIAHRASTAAMNGEFIRRKTAGAWGPWRLIPAQRVDNIAGRAIYTWDDTANREQLIYGDTGWRDIGGLLDPALWQATSGARQILVRREGQVVSLTARLLTVGSIFSGDKLVSLPSGFRGSGMSGPGTSPFSVGNVALPTGFGHVRSQPYLDNGAGTIDIRSSHSGPVEMTFSLSWMTADTWPTTLPGTAIGSIPNA